jgi:hypothetical protein
MHIGPGFLLIKLDIGGAPVSDCVGDEFAVVDDQNVSPPLGASRKECSLLLN